MCSTSFESQRLQKGGYIARYSTNVLRAGTAANKCPSDRPSELHETCPTNTEAARGFSAGVYGGLALNQQQPHHAETRDVLNNLSNLPQAFKPAADGMNQCFSTGVAVLWPTICINTLTLCHQYVGIESKCFRCLRVLF